MLEDSLDTGVNLGEQELIPTTTLQFFEQMEDDVAKKLTGVLNSSPARAYVGSYATRTGGRYCHHKAWTLGILPVPVEIFSGDADHLTDLVESLHGSGGDEDASEELDGEIADLYGLSDEETEAIDDFLEFFRAG